MKSSEELGKMLSRIDGMGYKSYKRIEGAFDFGDFTLCVDHVQGDPFAAPSQIRVMVPQQRARIPEECYMNPSRRTALRDFLTRRFYEAAVRLCRGNRGTGNSGAISIDKPGQEILDRTSLFVDKSTVEARFTVGLPAFGRRVSGNHARAILFEELPGIVRDSLHYDNIDSDALKRHLDVAEDADHLRAGLAKLSLVAFVADGAILPRASGVSPSPLKKGHVVPFQSPPSLRIEIALPNSGNITGMGIPEGVTLIVGGGYHGKSTLLRALELGIYNHIPGDGREFVITNPGALKIRSEDGRRIEKTDISPFISNLPFGKDTTGFSSDDASGSTSQAANIIEGLELGSKVLLIDEDTSATNFMIRDHRMQELVSKDREPITPFIDKVDQLYQDFGVSTIMVMGGSGDYFDVASRVICMTEYLPYDVTHQAREITSQHRLKRNPEGGEQFGGVTERIPLAESFKARRGKREVKIAARGLKSISYGTTIIDLDSLEQLINASQTRAIGDAIYYATRYMDGKRTLKQVIAAVRRDLLSAGLDKLSLTHKPRGDYAEFRDLELGAAINRMRTLAMGQK